MAYNPNANCPAPIVEQPTVVYRDLYHPQPVEVVHPVEIVNRHHIVPVPYHTVTYCVRDEVAPVATVCTQRKKAGVRSKKKRRLFVVL